MTDIEHVNKVKNDVDQSFQSEYSRQQVLNTMKRFNDSRDPLSNHSSAVEAFESTSTNLDYSHQ